MNTSPTFPPGSHLDRLGDMIAKTRKLSDAELAEALAFAPRSVQASPIIARGNLQRAKFALDAISPEDMPQLLAGYLATRLYPVKASMILRDAVRIVEGGK